MTDTWLTPAEVEDLTARKRWAAQCRALAQMGVAFRANAVGRPLVERAAVVSAPVRHKKREPDWSQIKTRAA
jgi:hypothetical protein